MLFKILFGRYFFIYTVLKLNDAVAKAMLGLSVVKDILLFLAYTF